MITAEMTPKFNLRGLILKFFQQSERYIAIYRDKLQKSPSHSLLEGVILNFFGKTTGTVLIGP